MSNYIQSQFRKQNAAGHGFSPENIAGLGELIADLDGFRIYDRDSHITAVGDVYGDWACEIPPPDQAIDEAFKGWNGFTGWCWDTRAEALVQLPRTTRLLRMKWST